MTTQQGTRGKEQNGKNQINTVLKPCLLLNQKDQYRVLLEPTSANPLKIDSQAKFAHAQQEREYQTTTEKVFKCHPVEV